MVLIIIYVGMCVCVCFMLDLMRFSYSYSLYLKEGRPAYVYSVIFTLIGCSCIQFHCYLALNIDLLSSIERNVFDPLLFHSVRVPFILLSLPSSVLLSPILFLTLVSLFYFFFLLVLPLAFLLLTLVLALSSSSNSRIETSSSFHFLFIVFFVPWR